MKTIYLYLLFLISVLSSCNNASQPVDPIPNHDTFKMKSAQVGETRVINVWTPPEYKAHKDSLPVLYMPDGGIQEDFPHIANTLAELIKSKKIKPIILVGIENTERRRDLTGPTVVKTDKEIAPVVGGSAKFRAFINAELFAEINKRYRTTNEKGIIGESLAGLFVTETFLNYPDMFDFYIAFDPSLWWNDKHLLKTAEQHLQKFPSAPKRFWFAGSNAGDISGNVKKLAAILKNNTAGNIQFTFSNEPKEEHSTIFRATKEKALCWTLTAKVK